MPLLLPDTKGIYGLSLTREKQEGCQQVNIDY
jgi:hypothetical protein